MVSPLLIPILAQAVVVNLGDRSEVRLRGDQNGSAAFDLVSRGQFALAVSSSRANWRLSYTPSVSVFDAAGETPALLIDQAGSLSGGFSLTPKTVVSFNQSGSYGERSLQLLTMDAVGRTGVAPYSGTSGADIQSDATSTQSGQAQNLLVPRPQTIRLGSSSSTVDLRCELDRHWQMLARVGYSMSGGLNELSRASMPDMQTAFARGVLSDAIGRRNQLSISVETSRSITDTSYVRRYATIILAGLRWEHYVTRNTAFGALAGASFARTRSYVIRDRPPTQLGASTALPYGESVVGSQGHRDSASPTISADLRSTQLLQNGRASMWLSAQLAPFLDRLTGEVVTRVVTGMDARWSRRKVTLTLGAGTTNSLGDNTAGTLRAAYTLSQSLTYLMSRRWELELGARQLWLSFSGGEPWLTWTVFTAVSYATGDMPW